MSFTVTLKYGSRKYRETDKTKGASEVWSVLSDAASPNPGLAAAQNAPGVPRRGTSFESDFYLQVNGLETTQLTDFLYEVSTTYEPIGGDGAGNEGDGDPLTQPPEVSYSPVTYEEAADSDRDGDPIATANNEPFDPALMVEHSDVAITITENVATFSAAEVLLYQDHTNADVWQGAPIGTAKVVFYGAQEIRNAEGEIEYYRRTVTIQVRIRKDPAGNHVGWKRRVLHQGFLVWNGTVITDRDGVSVKSTTHALDNSSPPVRVTEPVLLEETGRRLADGEPANFLLFNLYHDANFAAMNLGV